MRQEPYASAKRVFWIVDNGSSHRGKAATDRLVAAFPNAVLVHTPVHASWLNQGDRLRAFEHRYNARARPFQWKFTTSDLDDLLARLDRHTAGHPEESSVTPAA
jgi:hypothetical protein